MDDAAVATLARRIVELCWAVMTGPHHDEEPLAALYDAVCQTDPLFGNAAEAATPLMMGLRRQGSFQAVVVCERIRGFRTGKISHASLVYAVEQLHLTAAALAGSQASRLPRADG
jgi:hypothetical protein